MASWQQAQRRSEDIWLIMRIEIELTLYNRLRCKWIFEVHILRNLASHPQSAVRYEDDEGRECQTHRQLARFTNYYMGLDSENLLELDKHASRVWSALIVPSNKGIWCCFYKQWNCPSVCARRSLHTSTRCNPIHSSCTPSLFGVLKNRHSRAVISRWLTFWTKIRWKSAFEIKKGSSTRLE